MTQSVRSDASDHRSTAATGPVSALLVGTLACGLAAVTPTSWWLRAIGGAGDPALQSGIALARVTSACVALALLAVAWLYRRSREPLAASEPPRTHGGPALALLLVAAALLRIIHLDSGLWYDEIVTLVEFVRLPLASLVTTYTSTNNHILYSLLAKACTSLFGESSWALRLPAAVFGVASIWALFGLGREVTTRREALLASALMAFSYHHVWFSQNARGYTILLLGTIVATELLMRGLANGRRSLWAAMLSRWP